MFNWTDIEKAKIAADENRNIRITTSPVYDYGVQGLGLSIAPDPAVYVSIEDIRKAHPEVKTLYIGRGSCYDECIIAHYSPDTTIPVLYTCVGLNLSYVPKVLISIHPGNTGCIILENKTEAEAYLVKNKIDELENQKAAIRSFLDDPWKIYENKKKEFTQKLEKSKASTEFHIKRAKDEMVDCEKKLKEERDRLAELLKSGYSND